jgi:hypothetical protein
MSKMLRAMFALICAAILAGCGGDPGTSGDNGGDTDTSGSGTTQPHNVTIDIVLVAGSATDAVAELTAVSVWKNTPNTPMGAMPISYDAYQANPIKIDANDPKLVQVGVDVLAEGYLVAIAPTHQVGVDQLQEATDSFPLSAIAACDLQGQWSCTQTIMQNGVVVDTQTKPSALTMVFDSEHGSWSAGVDAFNVGFTILGDTISAATNANPTHGEIAPDNKGFQLNIEGANADVNYTCSR